MKLKFIALISIVLVVFHWLGVDKTCRAGPLPHPKDKKNQNKQDLQKTMDEAKGILQQLEKKIKEAEEYGLKVELKKYKGKLEQWQKKFQGYEKSKKPLDNYNHIINVGTTYIKTIDKNLEIAKKRELTVSDQPQKVESKTPKTGKPGVKITSLALEAIKKDIETIKETLSEEEEKVGKNLEEIKFRIDKLEKLMKSISGQNRAESVVNLIDNKIREKMANVWFIIIIVFILICLLSMVLGWYFGRRSTLRCLKDAGVW
jgi:hypothetical protein